jgi:hypothetical protein
LRRLIKIMGALAIVAVSFFATLWGMNRVWPACPSGKVTALTRPFQKNPGFAFVKELKLEVPGDGPDHPTRSSVIVCENNDLLGPMHAPHSDIAKEGRGRYSHWGNSLLFSTSDNSDPNTNGRSYSLVVR